MLRKRTVLIHCSVICRVMLQAGLRDLQYISVLICIYFAFFLYYVLALNLFSSGQMLSLAVWVQQSSHAGQRHLCYL